MWWYSVAMTTLKFGLCCISLKLQEKDIRASTMTRKRFLQLERKSAERIVADRTLNNVHVTRRTLELCATKNWNYRVSSGMMPLETLPDVGLCIENTYNFDKIKREFQLCADIIQKNKIRCSTHPDQFVVPASANPKTVVKSVEELIAHGRMMDMMGLPQSYESPINIHMNCFKGADLRDIAKRFIDVYDSLPVSVKNRLVLENEDKLNSWNVNQLYDHVYQKTGIPITYDNLHFRCNPGKLTAAEAVKLAASTWSTYTPVFHFSDNDPNNSNIRAHADYVTELPVEYETYDGLLHLEMEFKAKDYAIERFESYIKSKN